MNGTQHIGCFVLWCLVLGSSRNKFPFALKLYFFMYLQGHDFSQPRICAQEETETRDQAEGTGKGIGGGCTWLSALA